MAIWVDEHAGQGGGGGGSTPSKVSWGDIENKPETFKPEDHTHTIENIEDLSYQLEGKVSKKDGYNLSQENYTPEEKLKLENIPLEITKGFVSTVNGNQGEVILDKSMVGLDLVDNVQQASKTEFIELETKVATIEEEIKKIPTEFVATVNGESGEVTVSKETIGLSNVVNEEQATKTEFDSYKASNDAELNVVKEKVNTNKESINTLNEKVDSLPTIPEEVVTSVNGNTGVVTLTKEDVGLTNVTNNEQATKAEFDEAMGSLNALISQNTQSIAENKGTIESARTQLENKVDKVIGKQLSTNDFTDIHKEKLENLKESTVLSVNSKTGNVTIGKADVGLANVIDETQATKTEFDTLSSDVKRNTANIALKVDKEEGKFLSTNDFTDEYKAKVDNMSSSSVTSVNERTGEVILTKEDVGLSHVENVKQVAETDFNLHKNNSAIHVNEQEKIDIGKIQAIESSLNEKADLVALNSHTGNTALHVSSSDRNKWNNKVDSDPNKQLSTNDFTDEYKTKIVTNSNEIEAIKELIGNGEEPVELSKEVQANRESSLEQPNLKNITISTTEPEEKYEGLIWIKPLVEEE